MITILAFGDSLTAGFGLPSGLSFADQLQHRLDNLQENVCIVNAGISGDTTSGGLFRIERALEVNPDLVVLELGANDAILGTLPERVRQNLGVMITRSRAAGAGVLLAGIKPPMAFSREYLKAYADMFQKLAERYGLSLYPDFLQGVLNQPELTLPDGIHPNAKGVAHIVDNIMPLVLQCLDDIRLSRGR